MIKIYNRFFFKSHTPGFLNFWKILKEQYLVVVIPYVWLLLFFFVPFLLILKSSFSETVVGVPPMQDLVSYVGSWKVNIYLNFKNYYKIFSDNFYVSTFLSSIKIAFFASMACLLVAYPIAYGIAKMGSKGGYLLLLIALPFWTPFLIRVYAWMSMLSPGGVINSILIKIGIISTPLDMLDNSVAVCLGITYCYLPFMIFPIYASISKIKDSYIEAAFDLGCTPTRVFWKITVPLSMNGIVAGFILVFIPSIGEFVIPEMLGGADTLMIGRVLWWEFFNNRDWPLACALALTILLFFVVPVVIFQRKQIANQY